MIYGYGICEPQAAVPPPRRRGLGGATLRTLQSAGLAAVYSRHRSLRPVASPELVLAHERVLEAVMARGAVLPLRFGTEFEGEEGLAAVLAERRVELLRSLDRVRGHVEMGLRVIPERDRPARGDRKEHSGRDYLMGRVREHRRAEWAAHELHAPLAALASAAHVRDRPAPPAIMVAAYLVDSRRIAEFRARGDELTAHEEALDAVVTGPYPPYSFAAAEDS